MKKLLTAALSLTFVAGACIGMTGCKPSMGKIQKDLYDIATATSYTVVTEEGNTYDKTAISFDGDHQEWYKSTVTVKYDIANVMFSAEGSTEMSEVVAVGQPAENTVRPSAQYAFVQSNRYFVAQKNYVLNTEGTGYVPAEGDALWSYQEVEDKEGLFEQLYRYGMYLLNSSALSAANDLNDTADMYKWNKETERYELTIGTSVAAYNRLKKDGGVVMYSTSTVGYEYEQATINAVNETTVSIPSDLTAVVAAYITANPLA